MLPRESIAAMVGDGSNGCLHIYGKIYLESCLRNRLFEANFLVYRISDSAILGIKFLSQQACFSAFDKGLPSIKSKIIQCTGKIG